MDFEILEHPADIGFRVWGQTLDELFAHAAHALVSVMVDASGAEEKQEWTLAAEGSDWESLLVNWLNEVLYYLDTRRVVFRSFAVKLEGRYRLSCTAAGEFRNREKHPVKLAIKAVTFHQLKISKAQERWQAEVFVDV